MFAPTAPRRDTQWSLAAGFVSAHGFAVADPRAGVHLLGGAQCVRSLESEGHLHHGERLSSDDVLTAAGRIEDMDRVMYLRNHLTQLHRAATEGYPGEGLLPVEPDG